MFIDLINKKTSIFCSDGWILQTGHALSRYEVHDQGLYSITAGKLKTSSLNWMMDGAQV